MGGVNPITRRRDSPFSNTLVLPGFNLFEALKIDDPKKLEWKKHFFDLRGRHLEKAVFDGANLTKADLYGAELKDASLDGARLQGASLDGAQLQGASLNEAELQGASLYRARLPGASLYRAQLQGASLQYAALEATDLSQAFLWRTDLDMARISTVRLDVEWKPGSRLTVSSTVYFEVAVWDAVAYGSLRDSMNSIPEGELREEAVKRVERLDCNNLDKTLASCDPKAQPPPQVLEWQKKLAAAGVDGADYAKALAAQLRSLVCTNDANAIYILRGMIRSVRFAETGPALVDDIMSKDCPVSALLNDDDKAKLLNIKQDAEKKSPPPPASKKEK
jgi:Pentapeptide repeats (8 copies)